MTTEFSIFTDVEMYDTAPFSERDKIFNECCKETMICAVYSPIVLKWPFREAWMWLRHQLAWGRGNRVLLLVGVLYAPRNVYQDIKAGTHACVTQSPTSKAEEECYCLSYAPRNAPLSLAGQSISGFCPGNKSRNSMVHHIIMDSFFSAVTPVFYFTDFGVEKLSKTFSHYFRKNTKEAFYADNSH